MCTALFFFAIALTLDVPTIYVQFDRFAGVPNLADLAEHVFGMVGVATLLYALTGLMPRGALRRQHPRLVVLILAVAVAASIGLFLTAPVPQEAANFTHRYGRVPAIAAYWSITIAYFGLVLFELAGAVRKHRQQTPRRALRLGLGMVGAGVWIGVAYSAIKIVELAMSGVSRRDPLLRLVERIDPILLSTGGVVLGVGLLLPALETVWTLSAKHLSDRCALLRLRGLWLDLTVQMPGVVLGRRPSIWADIFGAGASLRLYRRVIEIRDVLLALNSAGTPLPVGSWDNRSALGGDVTSPTDVRADLDALFDLARVWPRVEPISPAGAVA